MSFGYRDSRSSTEFSGLTTDSSTDRLWILEARATGDRADSFRGVTLLDLGYRQGLAISAADVGGPTVRGREDFSVFDATMIRLQRLGDGDWGQAYDRDGARDGAQWETLGSIGGGVRVDVTPRFTITPEVAVQMAGRPVDRKDPEREARFLVSAVLRF